MSSNSHGFRSHEIDSPKKHVILMGDSVAWGFGMADNYIASYFLQANLTDRVYQVHNLAVSGYGIGQYYLYLKRHLDKFESVDHLFLMIYGPNDPGDTSSNANYGKRKPLFVIEDDELVLKNSEIKRNNLRNLFTSSYLITQLTNHSKWARDFFARLAGDKKIKKDEAEEVMRRLILKIQDLAESKGAELTLLVSPSVYDFFRQTAGYKFFQNYCENSELQCFDLAEEIRNRSELQPMKLYGDPHHYNSKGHEIIAEVMTEVINGEINV